MHRPRKSGNRVRFAGVAPAGEALTAMRDLGKVENPVQLRTLAPFMRPWPKTEAPVFQRFKWEGYPQVAPNCPWASGVRPRPLAYRSARKYATNFSAGVVQLAERGSATPEVAGSLPAARSKFGLLAHLGERLPCKQEAVGAEPTRSTNLLEILVRIQVPKAYRVRVSSNG
jgi:hypothetical protein